MDCLGATRDQRPGVGHLIGGRISCGFGWRDLLRDTAAEPGDKVVAAMAAAVAATASRIGELAQGEKQGVGRVYHIVMLATRGARGKMPDGTGRWGFGGGNRGTGISEMAQIRRHG